jgi:thioredoxin-related protein
MKILKFSLPTCKPCVTLSEQMKELDLSNFEIQEVNLRADKESKELGDKYNIRNVPTLVVLDEQGNEVERIRNIIQLKTFLKTKPVLVFEEPTQKIEKGEYVVGFDDYKEEKVKTSLINKIKNIFK